MQILGNWAREVLRCGEGWIGAKHSMNMPKNLFYGKTVTCPSGSYNWTCENPDSDLRSALQQVGSYLLAIAFAVCLQQQQHL